MYIAISYNSATFQDLRCFLADQQIELHRQEPADFRCNYNRTAQYINLVINDWQERQIISQFLDDYALDRFSYVHASSACNGIVEAGCLIYPNVTVYHGAKINRDVIVHSGCHVAHNVTIARGTFISVGTCVGGSTSIGEFCRIGMSVTVFDKLHVADNSTLRAGTVIDSDINQSGIYYSPGKFQSMQYKAHE